MNKADLVSYVSEHSGLKKTESEKAIEAVFAAIASALSAKEELRIMGFGTFSVKYKPASEGRNPKTGEALHVKAKYVAKFQPSKNLKETLENLK